MWIFSTQGFFSIVKQGKVWHVRARERQDLENLVPLIPNAAEVLESWEGSDYPWRMIVNARQKRALFRGLEEMVDYGNFKAAVGRTDGQAHKLRVLHAVWQTMRNHQVDVERAEESRLHGF